jgi:hypothetical protein
VKAHVAILMAAVLFLAPVAQATEIRQFDRFAGDDQIRFVDKLVDSVEEASKNDPALLARVKRFFMDKQPGEDISGMGRFELNLSLARVADFEVAAKNPEERRLEVEDVMYGTLFRSGITLPRSFRPTAVDFQPQKPLQKPLTREDADKALAQTKAWIARTVEPEHTFRPESRGGLTDDQKVIAFFVALAAVAIIFHGSGGGSPSTIPSGSMPDSSQSADSILHQAMRNSCAATLDTSCTDVNGNPW